MEIGKPEKEYTIEPAEPVPGVKERDIPPDPPIPSRPEPKPEREKVPA